MADKLGPGHLTFGEEATPSEWGAQCTAVTLTPDTDEGDELIFLSGDTEQDETTTWTLSGTLAQTYDEASLVIWAKENAGKKLPFTFQPRTDAQLIVSGTVTVRAVAIGGDVGKKNTSDFEFRCSGEPEHRFTALAGG